MEKSKGIKILYNLVIIITLILVGYYSYLAFQKKDQFTIEHYHVILINSIAVVLSIIIFFIFEKVIKIKLPLYLELLFLLFIISNFILGEMVGLFRLTTWFDGVVHTLGGSVLTVFAISLFQILESKNKIKLSTQPLIFIILAFALASTVGLLWEFFEYTVDEFMGTNMQRFISIVDGKPLIGRAALYDTMDDFFSNTLGSLIVCIPAYILLKKNKLPKLNK